MPADSPASFLPIALDPRRLAAPYTVQTNWHVLSGGPSCGKTTLINLLGDAGYRTAPEGARLYLERELAKGRPLAEIRADIAACQRGIVATHLEIERGLPAGAVLFLDRGLPDCLAWCRVFGMDPNEFLPDCLHHHYASVFILDNLPVDLDGLRYAGDDIGRFTAAWHVRDYRALGYDPVRVPVLPPAARLAFVLDSLAARGLL